MKTLIQTSKVILLALIVVTAVSYAQAEWNNPPGSPTTPNAPTPINVSNSIQTKEGSLYATILGADRFCLGSDCIDKWSDVINRGGDNSVDTTNLQNRVTGNCSVGQSIIQINEDGSVVCEDSDKVIQGDTVLPGTQCGYFGYSSDTNNRRNIQIPCGNANISTRSGMQCPSGYERFELASNQYLEQTCVKL